MVTLRGSLYLHLTNAPFIWRKLFPGRRFIGTPELPWGKEWGASQLFLHFRAKRSERRSEPFR